MIDERIQYRATKSFDDPWRGYATTIEVSSGVPGKSLSTPGNGCAIGFDLTIIHLQSVFNSGVDRRALYESIRHGSILSIVSNPNGSLKAIGPWGQPINSDVAIIDNISILSGPKDLQTYIKPSIVDAVHSFAGSCGHLLCPVRRQGERELIGALLCEIGLVEIAPNLLGLALDYVAMPHL